MSGAGSEPSPAPAAAPAGRREALEAALDLAWRDVSAATVAFHSALAAHRGLTAIEEKTLDLLRQAAAEQEQATAELGPPGQ